MMNCKKEQKEKINDNNRKVTNNGLPVEDETPPMPGLTRTELDFLQQQFKILQVI